MGRPAKKTGVTVEQRKRWLQRVEENGDSIADIVTKDGYDHRTVSRHLDLARQEREARETRLMVLRDAVQSHFADLVHVAEKMGTEVSKGNSVSPLTADRRYVALRQHLTYSPLWKLLDSWEKTRKEIEQARVDLGARVERELTENAALAKAFAGGVPDYQNMVRLFTEQAEIWKLGGKGLSIDKDFHPESSEDGMTTAKVGGYTVGRTPEAQTDAVKLALMQYGTTFRDLDEFQRLQHGNEDLNRQAPAIDEELSVIIMRKVVSGRCKYCPI